MTIWILEQSRDGGATWKLDQPYRVYKSQEPADAKACECNANYYKQQGVPWRYRAVEYAPVRKG